MSNMEELVIEIAIEPKSMSDHKRMLAALIRMAMKDSSFRVASDPKSGQTVIKGSSETQLEAILGRLKYEFAVEAHIGAPQVAYRETITRQVERDYTHEKRTGGKSEFARVRIRFEPLPAPEGFAFESDRSADSLPAELLSAVKVGLTAVKEQGVIAGFPMIRLKAVLVEAAWRDIGSTPAAFENAARACYREAIPKAGPKLLEPIMQAEVVIPDEYMGDIIHDLNLRRGQLGLMESGDDTRVIAVLVPLANMFGYGDSLRAISQGRARFTMQFSHYETVPDAPGDPFGPAVGMRA